MTTLARTWFSSYDFNSSYCNRNRLISDELTIVSKYPDEDEKRKKLLQPQQQQQQQQQQNTIKRRTSLIVQRNRKCEEPRRRKSVRFADTEGLILENIRVIHNQPEQVANKSNAINTNNQLNQNRLNEVRNYFRQRLITQLPRWGNQIYTPQSTIRSTLAPEFVQPVTLIDFIEKVHNQRVCLQSCLIVPDEMLIDVTLLARVLNISYEKSVSIRYTLDNWLTFTDVPGTYVKDSSDEWSDEFKAQFQINRDLMKPGQKVYFAISYKSGDMQYWDNNSSNNYSLVYRV